ncbi:30S ribosomal protein S8 [Emcibacter nanhaiensis]|uniref:Small ribosomal subunit protein uS8 n=1 Tax=Emcibacter nanhaiensis TaxID=1505037 RepID=A0A501PKI5_9PROT|nr:30S ribosomal protein S8 [Emcibacter nanhaiensis]TPD60588.1 30S ribosomal protein S8 [Emcibacter nanhaiensis]
MSMSDPLADMLTRIRNGQRANKKVISSPASKMRQRILDVLEREGYIRGYSRNDGENGKAEISIELKYHEGLPVIQEIKRISKPGRRVYSSVNDLPRVRNGLGISIVSTPKGVLSDAEARAENVGGEIICTVF